MGGGWLLLCGSWCVVGDTVVPYVATLCLPVTVAFDLVAYSGFPVFLVSLLCVWWVEVLGFMVLCMGCVGFLLVCFLFFCLLVCCFSYDDMCFVINRMFCRNYLLSFLIRCFLHI